MVKTNSKLKYKIKKDLKSVDFRNVLISFEKSEDIVEGRIYIKNKYYYWSSSLGKNYILKKIKKFINDNEKKFPNIIL